MTQQMGLLQYDTVDRELSYDTVDLTVTLRHSRQVSYVMTQQIGLSHMDTVEGELRYDTVDS